jgi:hypothetical protein
VRLISNRAYNIKLKNAFDNEMELYIKFLKFYLISKSGKVGISLEYTLTPLLTAVSHILGNSKIQFSETLIESFVCYSVLIGNSSMGKSPAMNLVKDAILNCEKIIYNN